MLKFIDLLKEKPDCINWDIERWEESQTYTLIQLSKRKEVYNKIVEDPKTLWDKRGNPEEFKIGVEVVSINKVKEALKAFIEVIRLQGHLSSSTRIKAEEIFGEEMLK